MDQGLNKNVQGNSSFVFILLNKYPQWKVQHRPLAKYRNRSDRFGLSDRILKKTSSLTWIFNELHVTSTFKCPIKLKDTEYTLIFDFMNVKFNFRVGNLTVHDFRTC